MLHKLCIPDFVIVVNKKNLYAKLHFGDVLKHSVSANWMQVKLLFVTFNLNCGPHTVSVIWIDVKFLDGSVVKTESEPIFSIPHTPTINGILNPDFMENNI